MSDIELDLQRKERLVQTYIIVYGLLVTCGSSKVYIPTVVFQLFIYFLIAILAYYVLICYYVDFTDNKKIYRFIMTDLMALCAAIAFCFSIVSCLGLNWVLFGAMTLFMCLSLFVLPNYVKAIIQMKI